MQNSRTNSFEGATEDDKWDLAQLNSFFMLCPDMFVTIEFEGHFRGSNPAFERITGYTGRDLYEISYIDLVHPDDQERVNSVLYSSIGCRRGWYLENRFLCKDGSYKWINWSFAVNQNSKLIYCVGRDVTDKKQYQESLRLSEERFVSAFDNAPTGMALSRLEDGKILRFNECLLRSMGYSSLEVVGHSTIELKVWVDLRDRELVVNELQKNGRVRNLETKIGKKNGVMRALFSAHSFEFEGEECILWTVLDITEITELQDQISRLDRLNLIGEMAAGIGHEVRNPMTSVRGFLQLLGEKEYYAKDKSLFDLMIHEIDRANQIITEFLSLAKNKKLYLKSQNINDIVHKIITLLQADALISDKLIKIKLNPLPDLLVDEKEISQLIINLVRNGLEATPQGGSVTVKTGMEAAAVTLCVSDHGNGIPNEIIDKLGTPFLTTKEHGTGIGLAICYRIAVRHNATINVSTGPSGTTFLVVFRQ